MGKKLLVQFQNEVLGNGPDAALPTNLSDHWLELLILQGENLKDEDSRITEFLAAVMHLLLYQNNCEEVSIDEKQLEKYLEDYKIELAFEEVSRQTNITMLPATLETIFTDRLVGFKKD